MQHSLRCRGPKKKVIPQRQTVRAPVGYPRDSALNNIRALSLKPPLWLVERAAIGAAAAGAAYVLGSGQKKSNGKMFTPASQRKTSRSRDKKVERPRKKSKPRSVSKAPAIGNALVARGNKKVPVVTYTRPNRPPKKTTRTRLNELEKLLPKKALKTYKVLDTDQSTSSVNNSGYAEYNCFIVADYKAVLDNVTVYDRSNANATKTVDFTLNAVAGATFKLNCYHKLTTCNNDLVPIDVRFYLFECNEFTDLGPTDWLNAIDGTVGAATWSSAPNMYPTDVTKACRGPQKWRIIDVMKKRLQPGDEAVVKTAKTVEYNPQVANQAITNTYQKGDRVWMVRQIGTLAHDVTTKSNIGLSSSRLDNMAERVIHFKYEHETPLINFDVTATLDTFPVGQEKGGPNAVDLTPNP